MNLKGKDYQRLLGVKKATFDKMLAILKKAYKQEHLMGGHPPKLSVLDKLIIMLGYYREYRPMENIAFDYGVAKSTICESIKWVGEYSPLGQARAIQLVAGCAMTSEKCALR